MVIAKALEKTSANYTTVRELSEGKGLSRTEAGGSVDEKLMAAIKETVKKEEEVAREI